MTRTFQRIFAITCLAITSLSAGAATAASCSGTQNSFTLDWNGSYVNWNDGDTTRSILVPDQASATSMQVDVSFNGATNRAYRPQFPEVSNFFYDRTGAGQYALAWAHDLANNSELVTITFSFAAEVSDLSLKILDVDSNNASGGTGGFRDSIEITASNSQTGGAPAPVLRSPYHASGSHRRSSVYLGNPFASYQAAGFNQQASNGADTGNLYVSFSEPVTQVTIEYSNKFYPPSTTPAPQGIAIGDLEFCATAVAEADIQASKTQLLHSESPEGCDIIPGTPDPEAAFTGPGACIEYRLDIDNVGAGTASDLAIRDTLDPNMIFQAASHSGFSSGGTGFGLSTPPSGEDCGLNTCEISIQEAELPPGAGGHIIIRALVK